MEISKTVNSVTTYYIYDEQGNMLSEIDSSGNSIKDYIYMDGEYIAHVEQTGDTENSETQEQLFYPLNDHLGQSFMVMRADEKFSHEQYTTPFGQMHAQFVDTNVGTGPLKQNRRFAGQYYDAESGYADNHYRPYDASLGIYFQPDRLDNLSRTNDPELWVAYAAGQIRLPRGGHLNPLYAYTEENPVNRIDPVGLMSHAPGGGNPSYYGPGKDNGGWGPFNGNFWGSDSNGRQDNICTSPFGLLDGVFNDLNNRPCVKNCCKAHDDCYSAYGCNETSWLVPNTTTPCHLCNLMAGMCVVNNYFGDQSKCQGCQKKSE